MSCSALPQFPDTNSYKLWSRGVCPQEFWWDLGAEKPMVPVHKISHTATAMRLVTSPIVLIGNSHWLQPRVYITLLFGSQSSVNNMILHLLSICGAHIYRLLSFLVLFSAANVVRFWFKDASSSSSPDSRLFAEAQGRASGFSSNTWPC